MSEGIWGRRPRAPNVIAQPVHLVRIDIPIMAGVALACVPIFVTGRRVSRGEGAAMVAAYVAYLSFVLVAQS